MDRGEHGKGVMRIGTIEKHDMYNRSLGYVSRYGLSTTSSVEEGALQHPRFGSGSMLWRSLYPHLLMTILRRHAACERELQMRLSA